MAIKRDDCTFFHVIDLPGEPPIKAPWDFRATEEAYHGGYPLRGKSVLELGCASGSHSFWMEKQGATVTPYDLSPKQDWDTLLVPSLDPDEIKSKTKQKIQRLNNGWNYCCDKLGSKLKMAQGSIYEVPEHLGQFDVVTFGSILLHISNPALALERNARRAKEAVIVTDGYAPGPHNAHPQLYFVPKPENTRDDGTWTWWRISPKFIEAVLSVVGFKKFTTTISDHSCPAGNKMVPFFTLIAER